MKSEDWIGFRQGALTIVGFDGLRRFEHGGKAAMFRFRCDCGVEFAAQKSNIVSRRRLDCGHSRAKKWTMPVGSWKHPLHKVWMHMMDRCGNPKNKSFK